MKDRLFLERIANTKILIVIVAAFLFISFFLANFLLAFLQEILRVLEQFAENPENVYFSLTGKSFFVFQEAYFPFYMGFYIIALVGVVKFVYNVRLNYQSLNEGQHGTSEFETVKELKKQYKIIPASQKEYEGEGGAIVAGLQEKYRPYRLLIDEGPVHTMLIGISRSGKGETWVVPMIDVLSRAKNKPSLVINDPKGELAAASYETLTKRGYEVHVFNLIQQHMSMGFDPLKIVVDAWKKGQTSLAQQYANSVAFSLYNDPNAKDPYWSNSAKSLVTAIILALTEDAVATGKEEKVNMYSVANFLSTLGSDNDDQGNNALDLFFKARDENNPARMMYATSNFAAGNTRASIFSTAMDKLQIFTLEPNAKLTSYNSVPLSDVGFGDKPIAIFMATPDYDESNHVLASIFISQLYRVNAEKATMSPNGKMQRHVHFILDEFGNMPTIDGMAGMVTVGAGRGFRFHLIVQAYSQVKSMYGEEADTIIGNCSNQIYILTKDEKTAEQFSALIGKKTITDIGRSGKLLSTDKSHSESVKERALLMPDELMRLKEGESVVVRANKRQDNKKRKIEPKPIFNRGVTAQKFRWEYLSGDFDTSRSIMELPIMSSTYHDMDLKEMVFTTKTENDQFISMGSLMGRESLLTLSRDIRKLLAMSGEELSSDINFEQWSPLHLFSYLTYQTDIQPSMFARVIEKCLATYIPVSVLNRWIKQMKQVRDKQSLERVNELTSQELYKENYEEEQVEDEDEQSEVDIKEQLKNEIKGMV
ncbi:VirD4-like conjugal transfer protein, CD1115 family [Pseudobacillus sp. 179-B 2D1 NHS]|uniref:VirD4-like conjugal transfer protein, CD1115 family n=1 Tax=Pseudobacillus sp. 179-B 2D1 NHS TaxID=3374292 RepID=UPI003879A0AA